jgi:2-oxoglutarate dehydrogenase E2 component (dihydrolipoamide succinyltransferase)
MSASIPVLAPTEQTEGSKLQVLRWLKDVGADVVENEPLIEIETDKVTVEVPAPATGVLREILRRANEEVEPGELLAQIEVAGAAAGATGAATDADRSASGGQSATSRGTATGPGATASTADREHGARAGNGADGAAARAAGLSPAVRRLLSEHALDAADVDGSGSQGRVTVDDVLRAVEARRLSGAGTPEASATPRAASVSPATGKPASTSTKAARARDAASRRPSRRVPHTATRKRIAERMVESLLQTAPHVTTLFDIDLGAVLEHRERHRAEFMSRGVPLTLTAYFLKASVAAIREVPEANARWTDDAMELYDAIDIGVGTAVENKGLVVPVVRDVQSLDLFGIAKQLNELVTRAREDKLTPADVRGGTFTISNHGVSGSLLAAPIVINQPQTAILGVGKLEKRPVVVERDGKDELVIRPRCYVTLTIDHRVMDGHRANRFLTVLRQELEGGHY